MRIFITSADYDVINAAALAVINAFFLPDFSLPYPQSHYNWLEIIIYSYIKCHGSPKLC